MYASAYLHLLENGAEMPYIRNVRANLMFLFLASTSLFAQNPTVRVSPNFAYNAIVDGFAKGDGKTDDTAALSMGCTIAVTFGRYFYIPPPPGGFYHTTGTVLCATVTASPVVIEGKPGLSVIATASTTANVFQVGDGTPAQLQNGLVYGLTFKGPSSTPPQNGQIGLLLNGVSQMRVEDNNSYNVDIGFDAINNCYGTIYHNNRAGFFNSANVGLNIRTGLQSGNQVFVEDNWFSGKHAGISISPGADGIKITGGQLSAGSGNVATVDTDGAIIAGKDYLTGVTGGDGTIALDSVDFEGAGVWEIRAFGPVNFTERNCDFLSNGSTNAIGIFKDDNTQTSWVKFYDNVWGGDWRNATPVVISGDYGATQLYSNGWTNGNGTISFNCPATGCSGGTALNINLSSDPLVYSTATIGRHEEHFVSYGTGSPSVTVQDLDGTWYATISGILNYSTNQGTTWTAVGH
jgi:hypothetical protein